MAIATNPFQFEPKHLDSLYKPTSKISPTQIEISKHLNLSTRGAGMAHAAAVDIDQLKSPLTQNTVDIYHQSPLPWNEFKATNSTLNNLGAQTAAILDSYKTNFDRCLYAPLSALLSSPRNRIPGDPSLLLQEMSAVYNDLNRRHIPSNCCLQICLRFQNSSRIFAAKEMTYTDFDSIGRVMRDCIGRLDFPSGCYCYKKYEILMDDEQFQIFEAKCNNSVPECSFVHPLCKLYNSTQNILPNAELNAKTPGLVTVSFVKCHDCIRVDLLISDGGQLYGKRIFKDDLTNTIPALFQNSQFTQNTQTLLDKLKFAVDPVYNEYYHYLNDSNKKLNNQNDQKVKKEITSHSSLAHRLPDFVRERFDDHNRYDLDISKLTRFFNDNNIDDRYIERHTVKEFRQLLAVWCGVSAGAATSLWRYLGGFDQDNPQNLGLYTFCLKTDSKKEQQPDEKDNEDEYDPIQDNQGDFYATLSEMYPGYYAEEDFDEVRDEKDEVIFNNQLDDEYKQDENVNNVQYGSYSFSSKEVTADDDNDYDDESLSTPWSDDEDQDVGTCDNDDKDVPFQASFFCDSESETEFENGLSPPPSDWDTDEDQCNDGDLNLQFGESLSTPSEWQNEPDIDTFDGQSYPPLAHRTILFPDCDSIIYDSMFSHQAISNWLIIRYLLFYERFVAEFYPSPK